jgi:hypothetical protein
MKRKRDAHFFAEGVKSSVFHSAEMYRMLLAGFPWRATDILSTAITPGKIHYLPDF